MDTIVNDCKGTSIKGCVSQCEMQEYGVIDTNGRYVDNETAKYYFGKWFLNHLYLNIIDETEANNVVKKCMSVNEHITEDCHRAEQVNKCLDFESKMYRDQWEV
ncbi:uncharacterized protein LOC133532854 [Cydia pomonella]|uniref:uncharacterized protein LOC133532854 n=1 Tax=Cydia pomonella TaxID=82600 RepID=UPI002ADD57DA|nr:uncharacterized protein LOC133532854 [Cydia pomonella]